MPKPRPVVVALVAADAVDPPGLEPLAARADVRVVREEAALHAAIAQARVLAVYDFRSTLVAGALPHATQLEWIHAASAGLDAVLVPPVVERNDLTVTNSRGIFDEAIAEYVLGAMLLFAKDFVTTLRLQRKRRWEHRESRMLRGQRLLVVGPGSIGRAIARLARAAGMEVGAVGRSERTDDPDFDRVAPGAELHEQLGRADAVVLAMPLTDETRGMIGAAELAACRPGAWLLNIARGAVLDEPALLDALRSGQVGHALLDVFEREPLPRLHPLWGMEQVIVSPHMAGDSVGWEEALAALFVENFGRWERGEPLDNPVHGARCAGAGREQRGG